MSINLHSLYPYFSFDYNTIFSKARLGTLNTPHGTVHTPNFIFCATKASIKAIPSYTMQELGAEIILANTYHLMLQPGSELIAQQNGIHSFMGWQKPMLSDSGGYQVFSMGYGSVSSEIKKSANRSFPKSILSINEDGVYFKSYIDGATIFLSPEQSIKTQREIGCDIILQFDECTPYHVDKEYTQQSMELSLRWGKRSLVNFMQHSTETQALYGIIQGGIYQDLRKKSAESTMEQNFFGTAIGGSLGKNNQEMQDIVALTTQYLHPSRPVHLLGIGDLKSIFWGVRHGIDTFDCVHPTRIARHAIALIPINNEGKTQLNLRNSKHKQESEAIDSHCPHPCCTQYSRAYIHHLFKAKELLAMQLLSMHNIGFMVRVLQSIRDALANNTPEQAYNDTEKYWIGNSQ